MLIFAHARFFGVDLAEVVEALLRTLHVVTAVFMAGPLYGLITVNERGRFGRPIVYHLDHYMENIVRRLPIRCYAYLLIMAATGLALVVAGGFGVGGLLSYWPLSVKTVLYLILLGLVSYVHFSVQPRIDALLTQVKPNDPVPEDSGPKIWALRRLRKRLAAACLFLVLTLVIVGLRIALPYEPLLTLLFTALAALFAYRAYRSTVPYGYF